MLVQQRTAPRADAHPRVRHVRPRRRLDPRDIEQRTHLRAASELYLRLADFDAYQPHTELFRRAYQHLKLGWDATRYRPSQRFDDGTRAEAADVFLRKLAAYQYAGRAEQLPVLPGDVERELTRWALRLLDIRHCEECDTDTLADVCPTCNDRLPSTLDTDIDAEWSAA